MPSEHMNGTARFGALLKGASSDAPIYDRALLSHREWLVAPTLGAVIPNWLLLIPRRSALSFREWSDVRGQHPETILSAIRKHLGLKAEEIIWFEHGPAIGGSLVGCGLDHAHIHVLLRPSFTFDAFAEQSMQMASELEWTQCSVEHAYNLIERGVSYFVAGCGDSVLHATRVEAAGSQFFRRVVSALSAHGAAWDYRLHPHLEHIQQTIRTFRNLEVAQRAESK